MVTVAPGLINNPSVGGGKCKPDHIATLDLQNNQAFIKIRLCGNLEWRQRANGIAHFSCTVNERYLDLFALFRNRIYRRRVTCVGDYL